VDRVANLLRLQAIEVGRATSEVSVKEGTFPAGSYVVKLNQPLGKAPGRVRANHPVGDMTQTVIGDVDDAPAGLAQPRIETQNPHFLKSPVAESGR
jgi:hypothetical protein